MRAEGSPVQPRVVAPPEEGHERTSARTNCFARTTRLMLRHRPLGRHYSERVLHLATCIDPHTGCQQCAGNSSMLLTPAT